MEELARLLLAFLAAVLLINLVQGGPRQVWQWLSMKFIGRPTHYQAKKSG